MPPRLSIKARELLRSQRFVIATWQGPSVGLKPRAMHRAARDGTWSRVTARTFLAMECDADQPQRRVAGALELGRTAMLGGLSALVEHGWSGEPGEWIDVVVPRNALDGRRTFPSWLRVRRRASAQDSAGVVPLVAAAESVLDAAAWARTDREAMFIAVSSMQQRIASPSSLADAVAGRPGLKRAKMVAEIVAEFQTGATTMGELDLREQCRARGLPLPTGQRVRRDTEGRARFIDAEFVAMDGVPVLVEIDGTGHATAEGWLDDVRRQRRLVVPVGTRHLRVTNWELRYEPDEFFDDLRRELRVEVVDP